MSATGVAGNSERTGMQRSIRFGTVLSLVALFSALTLAPGRASNIEELCRVKFSFYVKTIENFLADDLRSRSRHSLEPYITMNQHIAPFEGCSLETIKAEISRSRFAQPVENPKTDTWLFALSNGITQVGFSYSAEQRKTESHYQIWPKGPWPPDRK